MDTDMLDSAKRELLDVLERRKVVSSSLWHALCLQGADGSADVGASADELLRVGTAWRESKGLPSALRDWVIGPPQE